MHTHIGVYFCPFRDVGSCCRPHGLSTKAPAANRSSRRAEAFSDTGRSFIISKPDVLGSGEVMVAMESCCAQNVFHSRICDASRFKVFNWFGDAQHMDQWSAGARFDEIQDVLDDRGHFAGIQGLGLGHGSGSRFRDVNYANTVSG